jgi:hypothetical protein
MLNKIAKSFRYAHSVIRETLKSKTRSSKWDSIRSDFLKANPVCAACESNKKLQVHHIMPFHIHPELELEESNLITLCMDENECHLYIGHGDSFKCYNPNVKIDSENFKSASSDDRKKIIAEAKKARQES